MEMENGKKIKGRGKRENRKEKRKNGKRRWRG